MHVDWSGSAGTVELELEVDAVYTLSTVATAMKGASGSHLDLSRAPPFFLHGVKDVDPASRAPLLGATLPHPSIGPLPPPVHRRL